MLVIKIEIWPLGYEGRKRELAQAFIGLTEVNEEGEGTYNYALLKDGKKVKPHGRVAKTNKWRDGKVSGHPRLKRGPWDLLYRVLAAAVGKRNKDV